MKKSIILVLFSIFSGLAIAIVISIYTLIVMPVEDTVRVTEVTKLTEIPYDVLNKPLIAKVIAIGPVDSGRAIYSVEVDGKLHKAFITYDTLTFISANIGDTVEVSWSHGLGMLQIITGSPRNN